MTAEAGDIPLLFGLVCGFENQNVFKVRMAGRTGRAAVDARRDAHINEFTVVAPVPLKNGQPGIGVHHIGCFCGRHFLTLVHSKTGRIGNQSSVQFKDRGQEISRHKRGV
jgi:hypothetical protein